MLKVLLASFLLSTSVHAAPRTCADLFSLKQVIPAPSMVSLDQNYPLKYPAYYAAKGDFLNYFEMSRAEIYHAEKAIDLDFIRENHLFELLFSGLNGQTETLKIDGRDVNVEAVGSNQIKFTWSNILGARESLVVTEPPAPATNTVGAKADAYMKQFDPLMALTHSADVYRNYMALKLGNHRGFTLGGKEIGTFSDYRVFMNHYRLQRTLELFPLKELPQLMQTLANEVVKKGEASPSGVVVEWGSEKVVVPSVALSNQAPDTFIYNDQSLEMTITADVSARSLTLSGDVSDPMMPKGLNPHFEIQLHDGLSSVVQGEAAVDYGQGRITRDLQSMLDQLVPNYTDFLKP